MLLKAESQADCKRLSDLRDNGVWSQTAFGRLSMFHAESLSVWKRCVPDPVTRNIVPSAIPLNDLKSRLTMRHLNTSSLAIWDKHKAQVYPLGQILQFTLCNRLEMLTYFSSGTCLDYA